MKAARREHGLHLGHVIPDSPPLESYSRLSQKQGCETTISPAHTYASVSKAR